MSIKCAYLNTSRRGQVLHLGNEARVRKIPGRTQNRLTTAPPLPSVVLEIILSTVAVLESVERACRMPPVRIITMTLYLVVHDTLYSI